MLNVACFVQSRLTDADFVIFSNYCLIGTRRKAALFRPMGHQIGEGSTCFATTSMPVKTTENTQKNL